ncbi:hypothetical protein D3C87_1483910 [compost metagenome]
MVVVSMFFGDITPALVLLPTEVKVESSAQYIFLFNFLSYHSFAIIPLIPGVAPV